jgi:hypothetical protein
MGELLQSSSPHTPSHGSGSRPGYGLDPRRTLRSPSGQARTRHALYRFPDRVSEGNRLDTVQADAASVTEARSGPTEALSHNIPAGAGSS